MDHRSQARARLCYAKEVEPSEAVKRTILSSSWQPQIGKKLRLWSIAWPATDYWRLKSKPDIHPKLKLLRQLNKLADEIPFGAESKYQNTLAFFDWYSANVCAEFNTYHEDIKNIQKAETFD